MRSVVVVLPASICAVIPMLRILSSGVPGTVNLHTTTGAPEPPVPRARMLIRLGPAGYVRRQMLHRDTICKDYRWADAQLTHALNNCGQAITLCHPLTQRSDIAWALWIQGLRKR